ncbi:TAXI family TRAP transporter solute-binding subunit [Desulfobacula sp.]|uniref:TAXI family TRAP transporter solute-binding subunit n=1 Tax=Desulfobacula sp. TaxID=2593537 RepID=UPI0027155F75|nr:TAXI family TRAP transporter solute-binding subunit [Desulfobacula sp.]
MKKISKLIGCNILVIVFLVCTSINLFASDRPDSKTAGVLKGLGASPGGVGFMLLTGISKLTKQTYPRIDISVVPGGFVGNLFRVNTGEGDIAATTASLAAMAENKIPPYNGKNLENVMALFSTQNEFNFFAIVRKDLQVDSLEELFQKKLPVKLCTLNKGTATELVWRSVFEAQGVTWDDISKKWGGGISFVTWGDAVNLVKDGHADGILAVGSKKIGWAMDLSHARDVKILKWDENILKMVQDKFGLRKGIIPAKTYPKIDDDVVVPYTPCQIVVNRHVSNNVVKAILTSIYENEKKYANHHNALANFKGQGMGTGLKLPLHPAAIEFYNEKNIPVQ